MSPPNVFTVRSNSEMWRVISAPSVPLSRANFSASSRALVLHEVVEGAHLQRQRVVRGLGLAHHLGDQRVDGDVERVARLVARGEDTGGELVAGLVDLVDEVARAQLELEQQRVGGVLQRVVDLLGAVGDAVDDGGRAVLEFRGDAVDALVQHLVDAVGEIDELVVDVAGLEVEAGGQPLGGVEHGARGLGGCFLEAVEQVAAALAEREDHVVAGVRERAGDVGAAFFQRAGDALGDFVDARGDGVGDQRDVVAQVDLHAGNGAAHLLGLADQVVALMGDVLQQRADAHFVVGIGALERCDFVGNQRFEFAGARDRALDAVAHGGDFAADRLSDGDHGIAGRALRLGEADRDLRHRLRDHAHFLAAPGEAGEEVEQQHRRKEQRGKAAEHQHAAALADRGLQRADEAGGEQRAAGEPDAGENGGERIDAAGRAALLQRLQQLTDGLAVVIGGAARHARLFDRIEHRTIGGAGAGFVGGLGIGRLGIGRRGGRHHRRGRRHIEVDGRRAVAARLRMRLADIEGLLNGRKRNFCRVFRLFRVVRHGQPEPSYNTHPARLQSSPQQGAQPENMPVQQSKAALNARAFPLHPPNILLGERCE